MELFRPPFGEYDNHVIETAEQNGYYTIQWDVDTPTTKRKAVRILEKSRFVTTFFYVKADLLQGHKSPFLLQSGLNDHKAVLHTSFRLLL